MKQGFKVVREGDKVPFQLGTVVESLQGAGLLTDDSIRLARALEKHYRPKKEVKLAALVATLTELVKEAHGSAAAARFAEQPPPFAPLRVREDSSEEATFSRRNLAGTLEKQGYSFKEANTLARQIEGELRRSGSSLITLPELVHQTALVIGTRYGREAREHFEAAQGRPSELWVVQDDGVRVPYSRGILAQSLMALGLGPELSHQLAKRTEVALWRLGQRDLPLATVRSSVKRLLQQEAGEEFVRRTNSCTPAPPRTALGDSDRRRTGGRQIQPRVGARLPVGVAAHRVHRRYPAGAAFTDQPRTEPRAAHLEFYGVARRTAAE